ncbi:unnamed protein product [Aspergillus oryzae]|uniref:Unnamed protein product n=2 Tax=Aspergillus oryzae TaxID=5062 RepID=A0AAN5BVX9_ASPOZ|nr:unnamed protein product [Aspergillus oryzae]GMF97238.1 unnamed protein product [Aspergillus oryzae]GMG04175.1 unnamed protein product [Aspergillus oryzae]GMG35485.1 unnamed protein product [Aspergillus oryzae]GMG44618.1 unnamed protein product [Aspergillus oryzae var. brunneus]
MSPIAPHSQRPPPSLSVDEEKFEQNSDNTIADDYVDPRVFDQRRRRAFSRQYMIIVIYLLLTLGGLLLTVVDVTSTAYSTSNLMRWETSASFALESSHPSSSHGHHDTSPKTYDPSFPAMKGVMKSPCGHTAGEARARGCHFDIITFCWLPDRCYDAELSDSLEKLVDWKWYLDRNKTQPVPKEEALQGELDGLYVSWEYSVQHCVYMWEKMHRGLLGAGCPVNHPHPQSCCWQVHLGCSILLGAAQKLVLSRTNISASWWEQPHRVYFRIYAAVADQFQVASSINLVLQLSLLVLWSVSPRTSTSIPAATLGLANAIIIIGLSYVEDRKSTRPSSLLTVYLLLSILFDATQARTLWLTHRIPTAAVQSASTGTKLAMLLLEMREKTFYLQAPYRDYPPEATSGIVNLSFVWWINRLFMTGYRKLMGNRDLYDLEPGLASGLAGERLKREWENHGLFISNTCCNYRMCNMLTSLKAREKQALSPLCICPLFLDGVSRRGVASTLSDWIQLRSAFSDHGGGPACRATDDYRDPKPWLWPHWGHLPGLSGYSGAMIAFIHDRTLRLQDGLYTESAALTLMSTGESSVHSYAPTNWGSCLSRNGFD